MFVAWAEVPARATRLPVRLSAQPVIPRDPESGRGPAPELREGRRVGARALADHRGGADREPDRAQDGRRIRDRLAPTPAREQAGEERPAERVPRPDGVGDFDRRCLHLADGAVDRRFAPAGHRP